MGNISSLIFSGTFQADVPEVNSGATCVYYLTLEVKNGATYSWNARYHGDDGRSDAMYWDGNETKEGTIELREGNKVLVDGKHEFSYTYENFIYKVQNFDYGLVYGRDSMTSTITSESDFNRLLRVKDKESTLSFLNEHNDKINKNDSTYFWSVYEDFETLQIFILNGITPRSPTKWNLDIETLERIKFYLENNALNTDMIAELMYHSLSKGRRDIFDLFKQEVGKVIKEDDLHKMIPYRFTLDFLRLYLQEGFPLKSENLTRLVLVYNDSTKIVQELLNLNIMNTDYDIWPHTPNETEIINELLDLGFKPTKELFSKWNFYYFSQVVGKRVFELIKDQYTEQELIDGLLGRSYRWSFGDSIVLQSGLVNLNDPQILKALTSSRENHSHIPIFIDGGADPSVIIPYLLTDSCPDVGLLERAITSIDKDNLTQVGLSKILSSCLSRKEYFDVYRKYLPFPEADQQTSTEIFPGLFASRSTELVTEVVGLLADLGFSLTIPALTTIIKENNIKTVITPEIAQKMANVAGKLDLQQIRNVKQNQRKRADNLFTTPAARNILLI